MKANENLRQSRQRVLQELSTDYLNDVVELYYVGGATPEGVETVCNRRFSIYRSIAKLKTDQELETCFNEITNGTPFAISEIALPVSLMSLTNKREAVRLCIQQEYVALMKELIKRKLKEKPAKMPNGKAI